MLTKSKNIVGLDVGTFTIKAVKVSANQEGLNINTFGIVDVPSDAEKQATLKQLVEQYRLKGAPTVSSVSGRNVIIRYIVMKSMSEKELASAIQYEIDKHIPFSLNEVVIDCQKLEDISGTGNEMKVLLVAVKRNVIEEHVAMLKDVGLRPAAIDVDTFALGNCFEMNFPELVKTANHGIGLIDVGASKTNVNIIYNGISRFSREVYIAGNDISEAIARKLGVDPFNVERLKVTPDDQAESMKEAIVTTLDDLSNEISLSFDFFENEYDKEVGEIYLSGGGAMMEGIVEMMNDYFKKPIQMWDPTQNTETRLSEDSENMLRYNANKLAVVLGLGCRIWG